MSRCEKYDAVAFSEPEVTPDELLDADFHSGFVCPHDSSQGAFVDDGDRFVTQFLGALDELA